MPPQKVTVPKMQHRQRDNGTVTNILLRGGFRTTDERLDRLPFFDERSKNFPIRELVGDLPLRSGSWSTRVILDQDVYDCPICHQKGACTGFSTSTEAAARPVEQGNIDAVVAHEIYHRAKELDEWSGEDYEGSSVLGAVKAATERGWYREYRWALGPGPEAAAQDLALAVGHHGPGIIGSNWYDGMFDANADQYLEATGKIAGGHAYVVSRYSIKRDAFWTPNSWGGAGQGWISRKDMIKLLDEDGEACIPVHRHRVV